MTQRLALILSATLTIVALLASLGVTVALVHSGPSAAATPQTADAIGNPERTDAPDQEDQYREYFQLLQTSNAALLTSYDRIASLLDENQQLGAQNAILRQRDAEYQDRLAEANQRLQRVGKQPIDVPPLTQAAVKPLRVRERD